MDLAAITRDFALALKLADSGHPQAISKRSGRVYLPGIGPHSEEEAVRLIVGELQRMDPNRYRLVKTSFPYPDSRRTCDLAVGERPDWAVEVKMARLSGDNGKPDDTSIKDILSPFGQDRSAVSDCAKLATSGFLGRTAILIYGFEDSRRPLDAIIEAFEILASTRASLGPRHFARFEGLIHPVHRAGRVFTWEITKTAQVLRIT